MDGEKIFIQSMLNKAPDDINGNINQAVALQEAGCEIIRVAVPNITDAALISEIKSNIKIPLVADIHFDYKIALECISAGVDKIRINPGNIGDFEKIKLVANACNNKNIPIRIGVNSGSLEKEILHKHGAPTAPALVESALKHIELLNRCDFDDIIVSLKSSDVKTNINAYRELAQKCDYPLHLGVTEAGTARMGLIKSAVGIGSLLVDGIGETIRVSLTADPIEEIKAAKDLLKAIGKTGGVNIISCPTCGRAKIDVIAIAQKLEKAVCDIDKDIDVAIMGCSVNGPGEAREADFGVAGGLDCGVLFKKGKVVQKIRAEDIYDVILGEIGSYS